MLFRRSKAEPFDPWLGRAPFLDAADSACALAGCSGLDFGPANGAALVSADGELLLSRPSAGTCAAHLPYEVRELRPGAGVGGEVWTRLERCERFVSAELSIVIAAARLGIRTEGCHLYLTLAPDRPACAILTHTGIVSVVARGLRPHLSSSITAALLDPVRLYLETF